VFTSASGTQVYYALVPTDGSRPVGGGGGWGGGGGGGGGGI